MSAEALFEALRSRLSASPASALNLPGLSLRESAVLVPLVLREGVPHVLFTKRPLTLRTHAGQISFPGGMRDPEDLTPLHTALRETHEEIGVPPEAVQVLGMLDEIPTITQFRIVPFVGVLPSALPLVPNPDEIAELIEAPLAALMAPSIHRVERWDVSGNEKDVYFYDFGPHVIWGATARILRGFLSHLRELGEARALLDAPRRVP